MTTPPPPSPPDWIKQYAPDYVAVLSDVDAARVQAKCDAVLRDLLAAGHDTSTLRSKLQDAMWTKADFNIVIDGRPLIHHIIDLRDIPTLLLVISGSREKQKFVRVGDTDQHGRSALDYAKDIGWAEGAHYLALYGHDDEDRLTTGVHNRNSEINHVLAAAVEKNDLHVAQAALLMGGDPNVKSRSDLTAFHHAILLLHTDMVKLLAANGTDIHARHFRGETSLQMLWWCHNPRRLSDEWYVMADTLRALGCDSSDFKTPREMSPQELTTTPTGAYREDRAMDYALQKRDFDTYRRAFAALGADKLAVLTGRSTALQETPLNYLERGDHLQEIFRADLWYGQGHSLRSAWAQVAEAAAKPSRWRDNKPCSFTADDFARVAGAVDRNRLAARATRNFKILPPKGQS